MCDGEMVVMLHVAVVLLECDYVLWLYISCKSTFYRKARFRDIRKKGRRAVGEALLQRRTAMMVARQLNSAKNNKSFCQIRSSHHVSIRRAEKHTSRHLVPFCFIDKKVFTAALASTSNNKTLRKFQSGHQVGTASRQSPKVSSSSLKKR